MNYYLGIDQGSHSSRAVLFDDSGTVVAHAAQKVALNRNSTGHVEHDAVQLLDSVTHVIRQVLSGLDGQQLEQVAACGIATQRSTVLAWDVHGRALSPALSWQDVRAEASLNKLKTHELEIRQLTGLPLTPYYSASKMNWLLNESDSVKQCAVDELRISPLISYLLFHLLDNRPYEIDFSNAQRTQLFALDTLTWSGQLCNWFGVDSSLLPDCMPMCASYGRLTGTHIPVTAVCGDQNAAMFGIGAVGPGVALINMGSGAFVLRELGRFSNSTSQLTGIAYSDTNKVSYMREATINGAGNALSWAEQQWHVDDLLGRLPEWIEQVREPPVFINAVGGLGTPWMQAGIQPSFIGHGDYSNAEKVVAVIESIVFMIQVNLELMGAEAPLNKLRVSGGLSNQDGLCQKLSNLSGFEIARGDVTEATARGVAWLAAGRPGNWSIAGSDRNVECIRFVPQRDQALHKRYQAFKTEMKRIVNNIQQVVPGQ
jgi:glycerol kinase